TPVGFQLRAAFDGCPHVPGGLFGYVEAWLCGPAELLTGGGQGFFAQWLSMGGGLVLLGAAIADLGFHHDERRALCLSLSSYDCLRDSLDIVAVLDALYVPVVGAETGFHVFGERQVGATLDGYAVVVIQIDKLAQFLRSGQGSGL